MTEPTKEQMELVRALASHEYGGAALPAPGRDALRALLAEHEERGQHITAMKEQYGGYLDRAEAAEAENDAEFQRGCDYGMEQRADELAANKRLLDEARANTEHLRQTMYALEDRVGQLKAQLAAAQAREAKLREAVEGVADGAGLSFSDPRVGYEEWQIDRGAMDALRAALRDTAAPEPDKPEEE